MENNTQKNNFQVNRGQLYFDGHSSIELKHTEFHKKIISKLEILNNMNLKDNQDFHCNYENTFDLKSDSNLNDYLIEFLFDQDIPNKINKITGREYVLGDLVLRKSKQIKSYMPWHRDTYLDKNNKLVGRIPPLLKIIFYPKLEEFSHHELSILSGSTKRVAKNYYLDKLQRFFFKEKKVYQSNDMCILFDSSIIHSAIPSPPESNGSFRLIYNFCHTSQLESFSKVANINETYNSKKALYSS
tara:strand:+ start:31245 stop:31973 length:729 start_codon:yes stop_codon:yes gene_type:complete